MDASAQSQPEIPPDDQSHTVVSHETDPIPPETLASMYEAFIDGLEADYPGTTWRIIE
jgi:hypothetical protein